MDIFLITELLLERVCMYHLNEPPWFERMYPFFWHPLKGILLSATMFTVVAVSAERYRAVCNPLTRHNVSNYGSTHIYMSNNYYVYYRVSTVGNNNVINHFLVILEVHGDSDISCYHVEDSKIFSLPNNQWKWNFDLWHNAFDGGSQLHLVYSLLGWSIHNRTTSIFYSHIPKR